MSSFLKEGAGGQAELDRMQQRQLKEYSPKLHFRLVADLNGLTARLQNLSN